MFSFLAKFLISTAVDLAIEAAKSKVKDSDSKIDDEVVRVLEQNKAEIVETVKKGIK